MSRARRGECTTPISDSQTENLCKAAWRDSGSVAGSLDIGSYKRVCVMGLEGGRGRE